MPAPSEAPQPIIVIKKKVSGHGHHGGAWKVAYADFVTAMMALFIVLWLLSSSEQVKKAVGGYFLDPKGYGKQTGSSMAGSGETLSVGKTDMSKLKEKLEAAMQRAPELKSLKNQVQLTVTGEGLRVELLEAEKGTFFESGSAQPTQIARDLLTQLATELKRLPNALVIEGHTDSRPFLANDVYTNWELSADRANSTRRLMCESGLRQGQVKQVRGFADQQLRAPQKPQDAANRRVSIIVQYQAPPSTPEDQAAHNEGAKGGHDAAAAAAPEAKASHGPANTEHGALKH